MTQNSQRISILQSLKTHGILLVSLVVLLWMIAGIDFMLGGSLQQFGIVPRTKSGLSGIFFAPFLHANFAHLIANTLPLVSLAWLVMMRRISDFIWLSLSAIVLGGLGVWLIGAGNSVHLGASGVIFAYLGFLLSRGLFERSLLSIAASVVIALLYGSLLWGIFPGERSISWEGHFSGLCSGIFVAYVLFAKKKHKG